MNLWRINLWKEWRLQREFLVDAFLVALVGVTIFPGDAPSGFAVMGLLLAGVLGMRVGGDESMNGGWEFVLTRPIDRSAWIRVRFLLGFLPVAMLFVLVVVADLVEAHALFGRLVGEALVPGVEFDFSPRPYPPVLALVTLAYALAFSYASRETRPEHVRQHGAAGVVTALVVGAVAAFSMLFIGRLVQPADAPMPTDFSELPFGPEWLVFTALLLVFAWWGYHRARRGLLDRELLPTGDAAIVVESRGGSAVMIGWILVIALLLLGALVLLWLLPARVAPAPFVK